MLINRVLRLNNRNDKLLFDGKQEDLIRLREMQLFHTRRLYVVAALFLGSASASPAASITVTGTFNISQVDAALNSAFKPGDVFDFTWELDGSVVDSYSAADLDFEDAILSAHFTRRAGNQGAYDPGFGGNVTYSFIAGSTTANQYFEVLIEIDGLPLVAGEGIYGVHGEFESTNGGFFKSGLPNTGTTLAQALNGPLTLGDVSQSYLAFTALSEDEARGSITSLVPEPGGGIITCQAALVFLLRRRRRTSVSARFQV